MKRIFLFFISLFVLSIMPALANKIESEWVTLSEDHIFLKFWVEDEHQYLTLNLIEKGNIEISIDNPIIFQSEYAIRQFRPIQNFKSGDGKGKVGEIGINKNGISATYTGNFDFFIDNIITLLRITTKESNYSVPINSQTYKNVHNAYREVYNQIEKNKIKTGGADKEKDKKYNLQFCKKKKNQSQWDIVKEEYRKLTQSELEKIVEEWNSQSNDKWDYQCRIHK